METTLRGYDRKPFIFDPYEKDTTKDRETLKKYICDGRLQILPFVDTPHKVRVKASVLGSYFVDAYKELEEKMYGSNLLENLVKLLSTDVIFQLKEKTHGTYPDLKNCEFMTNYSSEDGGSYLVDIVLIFKEPPIGLIPLKGNAEAYLITEDNLEMVAYYYNLNTVRSKDAPVGISLPSLAAKVSGLNQEESGTVMIVYPGQYLVRKTPSYFIRANRSYVDFLKGD